MTRQEKQAKARIETWKRSSDTSLSDVYGRFSSEKALAWEYCRELCYKYNGSDLKVVSHNLNMFTAGFQFTDPDTGVLMYMHITKTSDTAVEMQ